jgi:hypothetical protein
VNPRLLAPLADRVRRLLDAPQPCCSPKKDVRLCFMPAPFLVSNRKAAACGKATGESSITTRLVISRVQRGALFFLLAPSTKKMCKFFVLSVGSCRVGTAKMFISIPLVMAAELHCPSALGSDAIPGTRTKRTETFLVSTLRPDARVAAAKWR